MRTAPFGPIPNLEVCLNFWWFVDIELNIATHWAARFYALQGTDEEKLAVLRSLSGTDYASVRWQRISDRHVIVYGDDQEFPGAIPLSATFREDPSRFEEILDALEPDLPNHKPLLIHSRSEHQMSFGQPYLSVETVVHYDGEQIIGPVIGTREVPASEPCLINASDFFRFSPSPLHDWKYVPCGQMLAFDRTALDSGNVSSPLGDLIDAIIRALEKQLSRRPVLAAIGQGQSHYFVVLGCLGASPPEAAASQLSSFPGYVERGDQGFDPAAFRPVVLWRKGAATELPPDARFTTPH